MIRSMPKYLKKTRVAYKVNKLENVSNVIPKKKYELSESKLIAKELVRKICSLAPYQKKALDFIKAKEYNKAKKLIKSRLGSWARANKHFDYLLNYYS